ncbi:MAG: S-methyl-5-thioribose-1-phosphate isomerase [Cyanobacteriota bacterium]
MENTVVWLEDRIKLIDQTKLPQSFEFIECFNYLEVGDAIKKLKIRGAPAIGIAGGMALALHMTKTDFSNFEEFNNELKKVSDYLKSTRPTAVNLFWVIDRINKLIEDNKTLSIEKLKEIIGIEALKIANEDEKMCKAIGEYGIEIVPNNSTILTHCNTGALATYGYGTALGIIREANQQNKNIKVFADETRPLLQGARLTTWELMRENIPVTLITDSMAGYFMNKGEIDLVIVGADRIAKNGDTANKIGTYSVAVLAKENNIPFYVAAPTSTIDLSIASGNEIVIEERNPEEITFWGDRKIAPDGVKVANPSFDVTPSRYITAIITEKGIIRPNYNDNLLKIFD